MSKAVLAIADMVLVGFDDPKLKKKSPTSSANTAARRAKNWKPKVNETISNTDSIVSREAVRKSLMAFQSFFSLNKSISISFALRKPA